MKQHLHFERPTITDHGWIAEHTFTRCSSSTAATTDHPSSPANPPKDWRDFPLDKFGECSSGHAVS